MAETTRFRLLKVLELLKNETDAEHPLSASEIIEHLSKYSISAERKAIYKDIEALQNIGLNIILTGSPKRGYYLAERDFELPEVCLLIDAVLSAGFIPKKSTEQLIKKLEGLVSCHSVDDIRSRVCIENRSKSSNADIYNIIQQLNAAILKRKCVKLKYQRHTLKGSTLTKTFKDMIISPYALIWDSDRYYLIGNNSKYDNLTNLRVDRIAEILPSKTMWRHFSEVCEYKQRFDTADYARKTFNMFGGEVCRIDLECKIELLDRITDKFTDGIFIRHGNNEPTFRFSADALVSDGLVGWIMQFGGDIKVLSPEDLKQRVLKKARKLIENLK